MQTKGKYFFSRNLMFYTWIFSDSGSVGLLYVTAPQGGIPEGEELLEHKHSQTGLALLSYKNEQLPVWHSIT